MYLTTCTRPNIAFPVNLLARYSYAPIRRHWNGIKHILRYLKGTYDMGKSIQKNGEIDVQQIRSSDNLADLFTKALPTSMFRKLIYKIGMRQLKDVEGKSAMT